MMMVGWPVAPAALWAPTRQAAVFVSPMPTRGGRGAELTCILGVIARPGVSVECEAIAWADPRRTQEDRQPGLDEGSVLGRPAGQVEPQAPVQVVQFDVRQDQGSPPPAREAVPTIVGVTDAVGSP